MVRRRFRFRLARLLRVREVVERQARAEMGAAQALAQAAAARRESRRAELDSARASLTDELGTRVSPERLLLTQRTIDGQLAALTRASEELLTLEGRAEAATNAWRERDRERRMLDELHERARTRHRREVDEHDQAEADEVAIRLRSPRPTLRADDSSPDA